MGFKSFLAKTGLVEVENTSISEKPKNVVVKSIDNTDKPVVYPIAGKSVPDDLRTTFRQIIKDHNLPGPDYYEFFITKEAMAAIPVPQTKYQVAFAGLSVQGLTKEILLSSAEKYKGFIADELQQFDQAFQSMYKQQVEDKKILISTKTEQMQQLSQQISKLNDEIIALSTDVTSADRELAAKKQDFDNAGAAAIAEIDTEVNNINLYI